VGINLLLQPLVRASNADNIRVFGCPSLFSHKLETRVLGCSWTCKSVRRRSKVFRFVQDRSECKPRGCQERHILRLLTGHLIAGALSYC